MNGQIDRQIDRQIDKNEKGKINWIDSLEGKHALNALIYRCHCFSHSLQAGECIQAVGLLNARNCWCGYTYNAIVNVEEID